MKGALETRSLGGAVRGRSRALVRAGYIAVGLIASCGDEQAQDPLPPPVVPGSAVIRWALEDASGAPVDCAALGLTATEVALGAQPKRASCGDEQRIVFDNLQPGRFPVVIRLLVAGDGRRNEHVGNVIVERGQTSEYTHTFEVQPGGTFQTGSLDLRWFLDSRQVPAEGCGVFMAVEAQIDLLNGPQDAISQTVPCTQARLRLDAIRQGQYDVRLLLRDASGTQVGLDVNRGEQVQPNETRTVILEVFRPQSRRGQLVARWTVNSSAAPGGCMGLPPNQVSVTVRQDDGQGVDFGMGTASCEEGELTLGELPIGPNREGRGLRATFQLLERSIGSRILDTQIARDIIIPVTGTSTVTVDFSVRRP